MFFGFYGKMEHRIGDYKMDENTAAAWYGLGKGIGIGLCGLGIGIAAAVTGEPQCLGAFAALIFIVLFW